MAVSGENVTALLAQVACSRPSPCQQARCFHATHTGRRYRSLHNAAMPLHHVNNLFFLMLPSVQHRAAYGFDRRYDGCTLASPASAYVALAPPPGPVTAWKSMLCPMPSASLHQQGHAATRSRYNSAAQVAEAKQQHDANCKCSAAGRHLSGRHMSSAAEQEQPQHLVSAQPPLPHLSSTFPAFIGHPAYYVLHCVSSKSTRPGAARLRLAVAQLVAAQS
jgi:hypothetical protein